MYFTHHPQTPWVKPKANKDGVIKSLHKTHVHSGAALGSIALMAFLVLAFNSFFMTEVEVGNETLTFSIGYKRLRAAGQVSSLESLKSVDVMKYTKDLMRNQQSDSEIENIVGAIADNLHPTHIALSIPMDASTDYPNQKPTPRTAAAFTQKWADAIHSRGINIIWRGTWSGIEGIYEFKKLDGADRIPAGTVAGARTEDNTTWLGKTYDYITGNPSFFANGDIWAPLPERTEGIFQDETSFLPHSAPGIQANYAAFFNNLKTVSDEAFTSIGKNVRTGWTAQNFTEVKSGWLYDSLFTTAGIVSIDHYGLTHTVAEMEADIRAIHAQKKKQVFLQEWGDYWNQNLAAPARTTYLLEMYATLQRLSDEGILAGFNYWGGWTGNNEGILTKQGNTYSINERGALLASLFVNNAPEVTPTPVPTPQPTPVVPPSPEPNPTPVPPPPAQTPVPPPPVAKPTPVPTPKPKPTPTPPPPPVIGPSLPSNNDKPIIPVGTKEGEIVKFSNNPTVYLIKNDGLYPFDSFNSFETYVRSSKQELETVNGDSKDYAVKPTPAKEVINIPSAGSKSFNTGSLVNDSGTIYLIMGNSRIPFTNFDAFVKLGFSNRPVAAGDTSAYQTPATYRLAKGDQQHPWGSWIVHNKTVYYSHESGLIGVPSADVLANNGGAFDLLIPANNSDIQAIKNDVLKLNDTRIIK